MPAFVEGTPAEYGYGPVQPAAVVIGANAVIAGSWGAARVAPAGNVAGIILAPPAQPKLYDEITVFNESANTVTFAAAATSNVADGATSAIPALTARKFFWDGATGLWYRGA